MTELYPNTDGVLWFNDGNQGNRLNTLCILGKKYYERFNYIYHPDYTSLWADNEFMDVANLLNKQIFNFFTPLIPRSLYCLHKVKSQFLDYRAQSLSYPDTWG